MKADEEENEGGMSEDHSSIEEYTETDEASDDCSEEDEEIWCLVGRLTHKFPHYVKDDAMKW